MHLLNSERKKKEQRTSNCRQTGMYFTPKLMCVKKKKRKNDDNRLEKIFCAMCAHVQLHTERRRKRF